MWVLVTEASLWGLALARLIGGVAVGLAPVAAAVWSTAGTLRAEGPTWLVEPWTWMIRTTLPLLGVHGNSVNLEPGDAAWSYPFWPGMLLQTLITVLGLVVVLVTAGTGSWTVWSTRRAGAGRRTDVTLFFVSIKVVQWAFRSSIPVFSLRCWHRSEEPV